MGGSAPRESRRDTLRAGPSPLPSARPANYMAGGKLCLCFFIIRERPCHRAVGSKDTATSPVAMVRRDEIMSSQQRASFQTPWMDS